MAIFGVIDDSTFHFSGTDDPQMDSSLSASQESLMANDDADGDSEKVD